METKVFLIDINFIYLLFLLSFTFFSPAPQTRKTRCFFVSIAPRTATLWCWQQVTSQGHEGLRVWQDKGKVRHVKNGYKARAKSYEAS